MRWADMDQLGHVNNVTYVDYLQEARIDMLSAHAPVRGGEELAEGVVVVRTEVQFVAPLVFRTEPINVECWVSEVRVATFTMCYEIFDETESGRRVYLRARTVLSPFVFAEERPRRISAQERATLSALLEDGVEASLAIPSGSSPGSGGHYRLSVRWSDVDAYGHVNNVKYFEYFQEARIAYLFGLPRPEDGPWTNWVVAHTDVDYRRPILFRLEPYVVHTRIDRVGGKSMVLVSEILDPASGGGTVLARAQVVLVAFDPQTQRAAEMYDGQRRRLLAEVAG